MSLPSKACNILRGRISFIAVNAREENHHRAIRALAYKWIRIIFACWKANKPYDESFYAQALAKKNSPLPST
jgi:hypothetical protein